MPLLSICRVEKYRHGHTQSKQCLIYRWYYVQFRRQCRPCSGRVCPGGREPGRVRVALCGFDKYFYCCLWYRSPDCRRGRKQAAVTMSITGKRLRLHRGPTTLSRYSPAHARLLSSLSSVLFPLGRQQIAFFFGGD